jgi:hypothetical protein
MKKIAYLSFLLVFGLIGCSSSSLKPEQRLDLSPYVSKEKASCIESGKYKNQSDKDQNTLCQNHAERKLDVKREYFHLYQDERMQKKCKSENKERYTTCVLEYQKAYFSK